jgi:hypothetical protein
VLGIAAVVYVGTQPRKGTVEWHKREYLNSFERMTQNTWKQKLTRFYRRVARRALPREDRRADYKAFDHHLTSLIGLGYLQKARVSLTNAAATNALRARYRGRHADEAIRDFVNVSPVGPQEVMIIAPPSELPAIEAAIRQVDATKCEND